MERRKNTIKYIWIIFVLGLTLVNTAADFKKQYREMIVGKYIGFDEESFWIVDFEWKINKNTLTMTKKLLNSVFNLGRKNATTTIRFDMSNIYAPLVDKNEIVSLRKNGNIQIYDNAKILKKVLYKLEDDKNATWNINWSKYKGSQSTFEEKKKYLISIVPNICHYMDVYNPGISDTMQNKIRNDNYKSPPFLPENYDNRLKGLLNWAFGMVIFGIICLVFGSCFIRPHNEEANNQYHEHHGRESKRSETSSSSTIFENKIESTHADAIYISTSMLTSSDIIATESYRNIMRKHFRSTSSSNMIYNFYPQLNLQTKNENK